MEDEGVGVVDGATVARSVRALARQARSLLADPADERGARELFEAIERLEAQIQPEDSRSLGRWLANLRRHVERRMPAHV